MNQPVHYRSVELLSKVVIVLEINLGAFRVAHVAGATMILHDVVVSSCAVWRVIHTLGWLGQSAEHLRLHESGRPIKVLLSAHSMPLRLWDQSAIVEDYIRVSSRAVALVSRELLVICSV